MKNKREVEQEMLAAYNYGAYLIAKAQDPNQKFLNHSVMCSLCLGTGNRTVYQYGKPSRKRCETATWDDNKKHFICAGNANSQQLETENKKDLSTEIWKIVVKEKLKEQFNLFLKQDYQTEKLGSLLTGQLYTILCMLRSGRLLTALTSYDLTQEAKSQKAA